MTINETNPTSIGNSDSRTSNASVEFEKTLKDNEYLLKSWILNDNKDLFTGPNNLKQSNKIHDVKIFSKLIKDAKIVEMLSAQEIHHVASDIGDREGRNSDGDVDDIVNIPSNHLIGFFQLGKLLTSHLNIIHGGAIATIIDEFFVKCVLPLTPSNFAVTANLSIKYLRPIQFKDEDGDLIDVCLSCFIKERTERKFTVVGWLKNLKDGYDYCYGEVLVVIPRG